MIRERVYGRAIPTVARSDASRSRAHRSRSQARPVPGAGAAADLPRPHPVERRQLGHGLQLRIQRCDRDLHLHLRLRQRLCLWRGDSAAGVDRRRGLDPEPRLADLSRADFPVRRLWNLPAYPTGSWFFNPFAWQLLFVFGAWCALGGADRLQRVARSPAVLTLAAVYLVFAFLIVMTWHFPQLARLVPGWMAKLLYPIDKSNLDLLRFAHFLALAALVVRFVPRDWRMLASPVLRPLIRVGQHSLEIFGLGIVLAFAGHFATVDIAAGVAMQMLVSALGIAAMIG